jgi:carbonic anhydrase
VVLGHTSCGAVAATADGGEVHDHVRSLVEAIKPAVEAARKLPGDLKQNSVRTNVLQSLRLLRESKPTLVHLEHEGKLRIIGAIYDLKTGTVEWLKD